MVSGLNMSHGKTSEFVTFPLLGFTLVIKWRKSLKYIEKSFHKKYGVGLDYVLWKNVWFCFISIVQVHFSHKTQKFRFWKSLKYFNIFWWKKDIVSYLTISHGKISDFIWFPLFGFILIIKLKSFDFESH